MKLRLILFFLFVGFPTILFAAPPVGLTVIGKITDAEGNGVPYAAVALLSKEKRVAARSTCNDQGSFELRPVEPAPYTLQVSCLGYEHGSFEVVIDRDNTDIGTFTLRENAIEMDGVTVSAKRTMIKTDVDRITYNVASDPDAATSNLLQMLNKVPFVSIDGDNKIKVFGETGGFTILINGRKSLYLSENNQYMAEMLAALKVKEIELITSPSGKYMNNTAVINIVTVAEQPNTIALQAGAWGRTDKSGGSSLGLTSKIERFIFNFGYGYGYSDLYGSEMNGKTTDNNSEEYFKSRMRNDPRASHSHSGTLSGSYDISANDLLTLSFNMQIADNTARITSHNWYYDISDLLLRETGQTNRSSMSQGNYAAGLNYQRSSVAKPGRMFTATYNFDSKSSDNRYRYYTLEEDEMEPYKTQNQLSNMENTIGMDFFNPINANQNYFVTAKYVDRLYDSESLLYDLPSSPGALEQGLDYRQRIGSVLGNYTVRGKKTMLSAALTYEYTHDRADFTATATSFDKKDHSLFGSVRFTYRPGRRSSIIMNVENSSFRPDITFLNPYEDRSVAGKITKGNPNLDNQKTYAAMIMYRYMFSDKFSMRILSSFRYSGNAVNLYSYIDNDGMLVSTYGNISTQRTLFTTLGLDYEPVKGLKVALSGRMAWFSFDYDREKNSYWEPMLFASIDWQAWKGGRLYFQMQYQTDNTGKYLDIQASKQHYVLLGSIRLSQDITKNLSVSFSVNNPWEKYSIVDREYGSSGFYTTQQTRIKGRYYTFGITYNFGRFSEQVKNNRRAIRNTDRTKPE